MFQTTDRPKPGDYVIVAEPDIDKGYESCASLAVGRVTRLAADGEPLIVYVGSTDETQVTSGEALVIPQAVFAQLTGCEKISLPDAEPDSVHDYFGRPLRAGDSVLIPEGATADRIAARSLSITEGIAGRTETILRIGTDGLVALVSPTPATSPRIC
ncbi:hypothetical protein [Streptomyces sp. NPDC057302]|uniref:hypothetical protein n=1 Tax=Streptomyces sp. NPDC057302 TaxID=3346094 RepID=UPI0036318292